MALIKGEGGFKIGQEMPSFSLLGVDNKKYSDKDFTKPLVMIIFTCNHCPYAQASWNRLINIANKNKDFLNVLAINSNNAEEYPEDSFENMKKLAEEKNLSFPYLYDETQEIAKAFSAKCTPDIYVFKNKKLQYRGRIDDNWEYEDKANTTELNDAIIQLKESNFKGVCTPSQGCSIKWK